MKMTTEDVEPLLEASERLVAETDLNFWRERRQGSLFGLGSSVVCFS